MEYVLVRMVLLVAEINTPFADDMVDHTKNDKSVGNMVHTVIADANATHVWFVDFAFQVRSGLKQRPGFTKVQLHKPS